MTTRLTRRGFLQVTGVGAVATLGTSKTSTTPSTSTAATTSSTDAPSVQQESLAPPSGDGWFDRPMRWVQLTLVENDPGRFDPQFWLDYFRRLHADAATLSAGGIVAYYPTEIPL